MLALLSKLELAMLRPYNFKMRLKLLRIPERTQLLYRKFPHLSLVQKKCYSITASSDSTLSKIKIVNGLPHIIVPLPSRNEECVFALKPLTNTVGDFLNMLKDEDKGIDRAVIINENDIRISSSTSIQTLFSQGFSLQLNDKKFLVEPITMDVDFKEDFGKIWDIKHLVGQLYDVLNIEEYRVYKQQALTKQLEDFQAELYPLEQQRDEIIQHADERTKTETWIGLGLMSFQFGFLARLTWWEYSWDIMEPFTYFITYGSAMAGYAYFVLTRQEYLYTNAANRQILSSFHKKAKKHNWDADKYNSIKQKMLAVEAELRKTRDQKINPSEPDEYPADLQEDSSKGLYGKVCPKIATSKRK